MKTPVSHFVPASEESPCQSAVDDERDSAGKEANQGHRHPISAERVASE
jgi:hypothetical protein